MNFYNLTSTEFSAAIIISNILLSFALQIAVVWIYKKTHRGLSYSQGFTFTLVMVGVLGTVIMMVVQNNLIGAFALLGAFSLIRFRTIVKETRDVAFVFFALAVGVAVGTSNYAIAFIATILLGIIILFMNRYNLGSISSGLGFLLTINTRDKIDLETLKEIFGRHAGSYDLLQTRFYEDKGFEYVFSVGFKDDLMSSQMIEEIKKTPDIISVELITSKHSVEY